jgi:hypothetical protein
MDEEHHKHVCGVLREVNEDEHDLRSGRRMKEFEFPGKGQLPPSLRSSLSCTTSGTDQDAFHH